MTKSLMYRHILFFIVVCGLVTLNLWVNAKQEYFDNRVKVVQNGVIHQKKNCSNCVHWKIHATIFTLKLMTNIHVLFLKHMQSIK